MFLSLRLVAPAYKKRANALLLSKRMEKCIEWLDFPCFNFMHSELAGITEKFLLFKGR